MADVRAAPAPLIANARYVHTNLVACDWRRLAQFYQDVFGCAPVLPERDLFGPDYERGTGVPSAHARGVHLRLPGFAEPGPTLEIFEYAPAQPDAPAAVNRPGFGHIAFAVPLVAEARQRFLTAGGSSVGEIVATRVAVDRVVTWCYVRDPEGNIVELQSWSDRAEADH